MQGKYNEGLMKVTIKGNIFVASYTYPYQPCF